jgi:putative endonuclease
MLRTFVRRTAGKPPLRLCFEPLFEGTNGWQATSLTMLRTFVRRYERLASHLFDYASHLRSKVRTAGKPPLRLCFEPLFEGTNGWQATSLTMLRTFVRRYERLASHLFDYASHLRFSKVRERSLSLRSSDTKPGACIHFSMSFHYVYILVSETESFHHYTGLTQDLKSRLQAHNAGKVPHTAKHRPWRIETVVAFRSREKAAAFEDYLKSHSGRAFASKHF